MMRERLIEGTGKGTKTPRGGSTAAAADADEPRNSVDEPNTAGQPVDGERARFHAILQHLPCAVVVAEAPSGRVIFTNAEARRICGGEAEQPATLTGYEAGAASRADGTAYHVLEHPLVRALIGGESIVGEEMQVERRDGSRVAVVVHAAPIRDADNQITAAVGTFYDISEHTRIAQEHVQARAAADEANRLKDEFLATLSHELRTPLNAILGWARMLRSRPLDATTRDRALATIERNALSQAQIIEDLLDVSRVVTGRLRLDLQAVNTGALIEASVNGVRPAAEAKGIHLGTDIDAIPLIVADVGRLQQVMWNLLSNAIKFTPHDGRVGVRARVVASDVEIVVADTGAGISPAFMPHVFSRFRQADSTSTREHGGLGLGLAIVRHLVELHGGTVEADSEGAGKGATFTVRLPMRPAANSEVDATTESSFGGHDVVAAAQQSLHGVDVLVVDDEPDARELIASILRHQGATVRTADSVAGALASLTHSTPRVLIADLAMPGEDGYSLIRRVRGNNSDVPAIALTAYARPEDRVRTLDAGFDMHLSKPVEPEELVVAVADLSGRSRP